MQDFNLFDIIAITLVLLLGLKGLFRGFIKEAFGLIGIVGGIFVASRISKDVGSAVAPLIGVQNSASISLIGFIISLIGFWLVAYFIGMILSKITSASGLGMFDRILGFLFGTFKVFLIFSIIIYALSSVEAIRQKLDSSIGNTMMYPIFKKLGDYIVQIDTTGITNKVNESVDKAVESSKQTLTDMTKQELNQNLMNATKEIREELEKTSTNNDVNNTQENNSTNN